VDGSLVGVDELHDGLKVIAQRLDELGPQRLRLAGLPPRDTVLHHLFRVRARVRLRLRLMVRVRVGIRVMVRLRFRVGVGVGVGVGVRVRGP
tara:strand:+ start:381 stop:656 length:276 start_codon:yes stop_codon:yes gene_type:complete